MPRVMTNDFDFLSARLHARRSRLAEGARLDPLCQAHTIPALGMATLPAVKAQTPAQLQRRLIQDLVQELSDLHGYLAGVQARFVEWLLVRFQVENLKTLLRGYTSHAPLDDLKEHLISLPPGLELDAQALSAPESPAAFAAWIPNSQLRKGFSQTVADEHDHENRPAEHAAPAEHAGTSTFFQETTLDHVYYRELLNRLAALSDADREAIEAVVRQEVDIFHLSLVLRGRFNHALEPAALLPLHVRGARLSREVFAAMLTDPDVHTAAMRGLGLAFDATPAPGAGHPAATAAPQAPRLDDAATFEALAWARFTRLANQTFRRGNLNLGVVAGYAGLRRTEVANLITLSEGIARGLAAEAMRSRLIPRQGLPGQEAGHA